MSVIQCKGCEEMIDVDKEDFDSEHELCEKCWLKMMEAKHRDT